MKTFLMIFSACFLSAAMSAAERTSGATPAASGLPSPPQFQAAGPNEFTFDTGVLRGKLRAGGKSLGLSSVIHVPSGKRLDRSNGLLSHYRVFTSNHRYGNGAWDWPSQASLRGDGSVEVRWPAAAGRPFEMRALYRWKRPEILDLETSVKAEKELTRFESFLASYFSESFTNCSIYCSRSPAPSGSELVPGKPGLAPALRVYGDWLMFPRNSSVVPLIQDGRWQLQPNPVNWTIMPPFEMPLAFRRDPASGLTIVLMSLPSDCFTLATPHQAEGHYSLYLSLMGRDLKAGEAVRARARMVVARNPSEKEVPGWYESYRRELTSPPQP